MRLRYHPSVQRDVSEILGYYQDISTRLSDEFWDEFMDAVESVRENPTRHHFDQSGLRRCNLHRFPYHILFRIRGDCVRILVVRHHRRRPSCGTRRR
ncbi:MAG: type II toxin-antitoxin system RelE/ParE family toxin [Kiritimatiellae bacterium]|nr:type II toxin-antitoxin system RelE/ParE family toxin [Kiritimatiellia bacterium]